jgi:hypothetical protein
MPPKTRRPATGARKRRTLSLEAEIRQIHAVLERRLEMIHDLQHTSSIQFQRIAQIQAELDELKKACAKLVRQQ